jgi:serine/threonine protein kinase
MDTLLGKTLGHYTIQSLIGEGGMGAVYKALDITLQRVVAVKVMHPHFARQKTFKDRFIQEACTAAQLSHPGIIKVFDFGQSEDNLFIVMEYIPGVNLAQALQELAEKKDRIILTEAIRLVQQVALAMDYAHKNGVLHRDIKPANIMLKPEMVDELPYRPIITDLGLAELAEGGVTTIDGSSMGTPAYMSPEQALGETLDARSDVYSLGILLFELCTGRLPFPANTISEAIKFHTREKPPSPQAIQPDLPDNISQVILKALQKDPQDRFSDAAAFASALKNILSDAVAATIAPDLLKTSISLATQLQQNQEDVKELPQVENIDLPNGNKNDYIQVIAEDNTTFSVATGKGLLTFGRDTKNDIVIKDKKVSRYHGHIEYDGSDYRVIDLNSANGTYLDDARLLPGVGEIWTAEKTLKIGGYRLRLIQSETRNSSPVANPDGTQVDPGFSPYLSQNKGVAIFIDHAEITVNPGNRASLAVTLLNQTQLVHHFRIKIFGIPENWIVSSPPAIQLMPGIQQVATFIFEPPRNVKGKAGNYVLAVNVTSNESPDVNAQAECTLIVNPFSAFNSILTPQKVNNNRLIRLNIENQGNHAEEFQISCHERSGEIYFTPPHIRVNIPAGQVGAARFRGTPRQKKFFGGNQTYQYTADIESASGQMQSHPGEIVCRPIIPLWAFIVLIVLCCLVFGSAGVGYFSYQAVLGTSQARALAQTAAYVSGLQSAQLQTQTAEQSTFATATVLAITAQAAGDNDNDGISNIQENSLGTDPNNPDTDNDGLIDGLEINQYGTNPKNQDTDGDTLSDGMEANDLKTSPTNKDTDGDGLNDNVDPAPLQLPTVTVSPTGTIQPTTTAWKACPDAAYSTRLAVGMEAFVSPDPPLANRVRSAPSTGGDILGYIQPGEHVKILEGPQCSDKWIWWKVESLTSGLTGWTGEGDENGYWLVPVP